MHENDRRAIGIFIFVRRHPLPKPRTHKICDIKNFFGIKFGDFCKIWILANLKSLTLKFQNLKSLTLKFQNLKSLTLTQKFPIWTQFF